VLWLYDSQAVTKFVCTTTKLNTTTLKILIQDFFWKLRKETMTSFSSMGMANGWTLLFIMVCFALAQCAVLPGKQKTPLQLPGTYYSGQKYIHLMVDKMLCFFLAVQIITFVSSIMFT